MNKLPVLSPAGAAFIGSFEGFVATPYNDQGQNATIGFGHLLHYGPVTDADRRRWDSLTRAQGARLLQHDATAALYAIERAVSVPLTQYQVDALCSFVYNCGGASLDGMVGRYVNARPRLYNPVKRKAWRTEVATAMLAWDHVGGQVSQGLLRRRQAEGYLFLTGRYDRARGNLYANV